MEYLLNAAFLMKCFINMVLILPQLIVGHFNLSDVYFP